MSGVFGPDVRCVNAAVGSDAGFYKAVPDRFGVVEVIGDVFACLLITFRRVYSFGRSLDDVSHAVEFCILAGASTAR